MAKKHDENKDLKSFARIGKIDYGNKILYAPKSATIGIHLWGKIDFLRHYCGWWFAWTNNAAPSVQSNGDSNDNVKAAKKNKNEHKLTDKTKKNKKK